MSTPTTTYDFETEGEGIRADVRQRISDFVDANPEVLPAKLRAGITPQTEARIRERDEEESN